MATPLDDLLEAHGWSARRLALSGGPPASTLYGWRIGKRLPRKPTLLRVAVVLGVPFHIVSDAVAQTIAEARARRAAEERSP